MLSLSLISIDAPFGVGNSGHATPHLTRAQIEPRVNRKGYMDRCELRGDVQMTSALRGREGVSQILAIAREVA